MDSVLIRLLEAYQIPFKRGWQAALAKKVKVEPHVVSGWKNDPKRKVPERIIANASIETGFTKEWILTGEGEKFFIEKGTKVIPRGGMVRQSEERRRKRQEPIDSPPRVVRDTAVDMMEWLAENSPHDFYELLKLIRATHNRCRSDKEKSSQLEPSK